MLAAHGGAENYGLGMSPHTHELLYTLEHTHGDAPLFRQVENSRLALAAACVPGHQHRSPTMQLLTCQVLKLKYSLSCLQALLYIPL